MIRPVERFSVNIAPAVTPADAASSRGGLGTGPSVMVLALLAGAGIGGLLPTVGAHWPDADAAIEPAAGPEITASAIAQAPDGGFYVRAILDSMPLVVRLDPSLATSVLRPADAMRLAPTVKPAGSVNVGRLALGGWSRGPVTLQVADADIPVTILGAELLDGFGPDIAGHQHVRREGD